MGVRKFHVLDMMVLVAAIAGTVSWYRVLVPEMRRIAGMNSPGWSRQPWMFALQWWPLAAVPALMAGSVVIFALLLRPPRPRWRRLVRQPGAAACGVAVLTFGSQILIAVVGMGLARIPNLNLTWAAGPNHEWTWRGATTSATEMADTGLAVIGAWAILRMSRLWRAEPSWIDRTGRFIGGGWIALWSFRKLLTYTLIA